MRASSFESLFLLQTIAFVAVDLSVILLLLLTLLNFCARKWGLFAPQLEKQINRVKPARGNSSDSRALTFVISDVFAHGKSDVQKNTTFSSSWTEFVFLQHMTVLFTVFKFILQL